MSPQKRYVLVLTPNTSECDLTWKWSLYRDNQLKMSSVEWSLIPYDWYPYKKWKFGHRDRHTQEACDVKMED